MSQDLESQQMQEHKLAVNPKGTVPSSITKVKTEGDYIQFGNEKYLRSELVEAFGGSLNPGLSPPPKHDLANPGPLGLSAFALTTFVLSLINVEARGVTIPNIVVGLAFFYGGFAQLVAGMFEIAVGNTFGGVALSSYGGFWCAWAAIQVPSFGIASAYTDPQEFRFAIAIFLLGWFIFTFFLMLLTLKSTVAFFSIFFFLSITFLLLAIADFKHSVPIKKAGGVFGIITAFAAWYNAYAGIANEQNSYITVKAIHLPDLEGDNVTSEDPSETLVVEPRKGLGIAACSSQGLGFFVFGSKCLLFGVDNVTVRGHVGARGWDLVGFVEQLEKNVHEQENRVHDVASDETFVGEGCAQEHCEVLDQRDEDTDGQRNVRPVRAEWGLVGQIPISVDAAGSASPHEADVNNQNTNPCQQTTQRHHVDKVAEHLSGVRRHRHESQQAECKRESNSVVWNTHSVGDGKEFWSISRNRQTVDGSGADVHIGVGSRQHEQHDTGVDDMIKPTNVGIFDSNHKWRSTGSGSRSS